MTFSHLANQLVSYSCSYIASVFIWKLYLVKAVIHVYMHAYVDVFNYVADQYIRNVSFTVDYCTVDSSGAELVAKTIQMSSKRS